MRKSVVLPEELEILVKEVRDLKAAFKSDARHIDDPILNTEGLMNLLKVSPRTCQHWRDKGIIAFSQVNGKYYYRMSDVNRMLDAHLVKGN